MLVTGVDTGEGEKETLNLGHMGFESLRPKGQIESPSSGMNGAQAE
jgi:hypothetical protein